jgi:hypothetical protein
MTAHPKPINRNRFRVICWSTEWWLFERRAGDYPGIRVTTDGAVQMLAWVTSCC